MTAVTNGCPKMFELGRATARLALDDALSASF